MVKKAVSILKYVFSLGLAFLLLYFAFRNIDFSEFRAKAEKVNYLWVIISIVLSVLSYIARAYRWNLLLKPLGYHRLTIFRTTLAVLIGYLANLAFPRLGEVTRCAMLNRSDDVPVSASLGTVITERIIDLFSLIFIFLFALAFEYDRLVSFLSGALSGLEDIQGLAWKVGLIAVGVGAILLIIGIALFRRSDRIREFIRQLIQGLLSLGKIKNFTGFIISTVLLWLIYYFMSYVIVFSIQDTAHLSWMVGVMILVTGGIALALPVQGGIGTYHAFVSGMLVLYAIDSTTGVFLATLLHTSQIIAMAIFGGIAVLIFMFLIKKRKNESHEAENNDRP